MGWLFDPDERWDNLEVGLLITAGLFGVFGVHRIYERGDVAGIAMTFAPGAIALALWFLVRFLRERAASRHPRGVVLAIVGAIAAVIGAVAIASDYAPDSEPADDSDGVELSDVPIRIDNVEVGEMPNPAGSGTIPTLVGKHHAR